MDEQQQKAMLKETFDTVSGGYDGKSRNVGYCVDGAERWWDVIWNAGFRRLVSLLPEDARQRFKQEHLKEIEALETKDGIWLDVGVLYAVGTKPS